MNRESLSSKSLSVRVQHLEDKLLELTFINEELLGALSYVVGNLERTGVVSRQDAFRSTAVHVDMRLQDVTHALLGSDSGYESNLHFGDEGESSD